MTEEEYYQIVRREKIFYTVLIIAWLFAFAIWFIVGFSKAKWVLIGGGTLIYLYLKSTFTGLPWSRKLVKPEPIAMKKEIQREEDFSPVSEMERKGYVTLAELCLSKETREKWKQFFETLRDYSSAGADWEYGSTLHYVMEHMEEVHISFLMGLDWKAEVETLEWRIKSALAENFRAVVDLPDFKHYGEKTVSVPFVFADYDKALSKNGFQLGFIDTDSDMYVIFVHRTADRDQVESAVRHIGYKYNEAEDLKL